MKRIFAFFLSLIILTGLCGCSASAISVKEKRTAETLTKAEAFWAEQTVRQAGEPVVFADYKNPLPMPCTIPKQDMPIQTAALRPSLQNSGMPLNRNICRKKTLRAKNSAVSTPLPPCTWTTKPTCPTKPI